MDNAHGWRPISTAPRDGTRVLLGSPDHVCVGYWVPHFEYVEELDSGDENNPNTGYRGAWTDGTVASWGYQELNERHPTDWQPLPAPPQDREDGRDE